jgi:hypothetical protein
MSSEFLLEPFVTTVPAALDRRHFDWRVVFATAALTSWRGWLGKSKRPVAVKGLRDA